MSRLIAIKFGFGSQLLLQRRLLEPDFSCAWHLFSTATERRSSALYLGMNGSMPVDASDMELSQSPARVELRPSPSRSRSDAKLPLPAPTAAPRYASVSPSFCNRRCLGVSMTKCAFGRRSFRSGAIASYDFSVSRSHLAGFSAFPFSTSCSSSIS